MRLDGQKASSTQRMRRPQVTWAPLIFVTSTGGAAGAVTAAGLAGALTPFLRVMPVRAVLGAGHAFTAVLGSALGSGGGCGKSPAGGRSRGAPCPASSSRGAVFQTRAALARISAARMT